MIPFTLNSSVHFFSCNLRWWIFAGTGCQAPVAPNENQMQLFCVLRTFLAFFSQRKEKPARIPVCKNTRLTYCVSYFFYIHYSFFVLLWLGTIIRIEEFKTFTIKVGWIKYSSNMIPPHVVKWIESHAVPAPCTAPRWIWLHGASPRGQMRVQTGGDVIKRQIPHWLH